MPDAAREVSVAGRDRIRADVPRRELEGQPLRVVDQRSLEGAVGTGREVDLPPGDADGMATFRVVVNDEGDPPAAPIVECRPANNQAETTGDCAILL